VIIRPRRDRPRSPRRLSYVGSVPWAMTCPKFKTTSRSTSGHNEFHVVLDEQHAHSGAQFNDEMREVLELGFVQPEAGSSKSSSVGALISALATETFFAMPYGIADGSRPAISEIPKRSSIASASRRKARSERTSLGSEEEARDEAAVGS